jgi:hypothetical protein
MHTHTCGDSHAYTHVWRLTCIHTRVETHMHTHTCGDSDAYTQACSVCKSKQAYFPHPYILASCMHTHRREDEPRASNTEIVDFSGGINFVDLTDDVGDALSGSVPTSEFAYLQMR